MQIDLYRHISLQGCIFLIVREHSDIFNVTETTLDENIYMFVYTLSKMNVKDKERFCKHNLSKCVFHYGSYSM
jgi:hypothetical protein